MSCYNKKHLQQTGPQQQSPAHAAKLSSLRCPEWCFRFLCRFQTVEVIHLQDWQGYVQLCSNTVTK